MKFELIGYSERIIRNILEAIEKNISDKEILSERKILNLTLKINLLARRRGVIVKWDESLVISLAKFFSLHCNESETVLLSKLNNFLYNR